MKLAGEQAIQKAGGAYLILHTSWVYSMSGDNFLTKILGWARKNPELRVVDDQVGNPTWARMLAEATSQILARGNSYLSEHKGVYHLAGDEVASRLEWARKILALDPHREEQVCKEILPALTSDFPTPARRPLCSALNCDHFASTFGLRLPDWEAALPAKYPKGEGGNGTLRMMQPRLPAASQLQVCSAWDFGLLPDWETVGKIRCPVWREAV